MSFLQTNFGTLNTAALLVETHTGAAAATSFHIVVDSVSVTLNGSGTGTATVTLSGNAPFTSGSTYAVNCDLPSGATSTATVTVANTSGSVFVVSVVGDAAHASGPITVAYVASGT